MMCPGSHCQQMAKSVFKSRSLDQALWSTTILSSATSKSSPANELLSVHNHVSIISKLRENNSEIYSNLTLLLHPSMQSLDRIQTNLGIVKGT